jgi:hypothetical protein
MRTLTAATKAMVLHGTKRRRRRRRRRSVGRLTCPIQRDHIAPQLYPPDSTCHVNGNQTLIVKLKTKP